MIGIAAWTVCILVGGWAILGLLILAAWWWRDRRFNRHTDQALAVTRHPSATVPVEDRPDWPPR